MNDVLNRPRAEAVLAEAGVDVLVCTTHANVFYLTGYIGFVQRLMPATQVYAVARADALEAPVLIAPIGDLDMQAQFPARVGRIRQYGSFFVEGAEAAAGASGEEARYGALSLEQPEADPTEMLLDELARLPAQARIAVDERGIAAAALGAVQRRFGDRVVSGAALLDRIRMVKTPEEVRRLEVAALATEQSYLAAIAAATEGLSEAAMARVFDGRTIEQGAQPHFTVIAFGERGAFPNAIPSEERLLRRGDAIRFDVGVREAMYHSDIARTAVFGEPSAQCRAYYEAILVGEQLMFEAMRPGVTAREVYDVSIAAVREAGIPHYRRHHVGHGIGLDTYDPPVLNASTDTVLEPGMVFEIETPYYELGFGGIQVEDTVLVTEDGARLLTQTPRELLVLDQ